MSPIAVAMAAPFRWLGKALDVGRRNPKALFGGLSLVLVLVFAISMLQGLLQAALGPGGLAVAMVAGTLASWLLLPPAFGGVFRVLEASDRGRPVVASDVFNVFGDRAGYRRLVGVNVVYSMAYLALIGMFLPTSLGQFLREYFAIALATPPGGQPDQQALVDLIRGTSPTVLLWMPVAALVAATWLHASMLAQATAALRTASVAECVVAGALAMARNVLPLLGVSVAVMVGGFAVAMLLGLVLVLVAGLFSLLSPVLGLFVMLPLMLLGLLAMYALMFGFYYHGWREIFGEPGEAPPAASGELAA